jgi:hypothetical protein
MIAQFTIFGERCSGTNYLEEVILNNFDINVTYEYSHKHFFGFQNELLQISDDTLFICIVREPISWINSFFKNMHHLSLQFMELDKNIKKYLFLNAPIWSLHENNTENLFDRNIYTGKRYKNIFELRYTKLKYQLTYLPTQVKNYIFIRYEDLLTNFNETMHKIKNKGLKVKNEDTFPLNSNKYKNTNKIFTFKKNYEIHPDKILNNPFFKVFNEYDKKLGYVT